MTPDICTRRDLGHDGPCNGDPAETCWRHISSCPVGIVVFTKIDDEQHGARNVDTKLIIDPNFRFRNPDGAVIHYVPTHWRPHGAPRPDSFDARAARLLRAACEDAFEILRDLSRPGQLSPTPNQRLVMGQVLINAKHALARANMAGIVRATDVNGGS